MTSRTITSQQINSTLLQLLLDCQQCKLLNIHPQIPLIFSVFCFSTPYTTIASRRTQTQSLSIIFYHWTTFSSSGLHSSDRTTERQLKRILQCADTLYQNRSLFIPTTCLPVLCRLRGWPSFSQPVSFSIHSSLPSERGLRSIRQCQPQTPVAPATTLEKNFVTRRMSFSS